METTPLTRRSAPLRPFGSERPSPPLGFRAAQPYPHNYESHDVVSRAAAIIWEADPHDFRTRFVSRQAEEILGYPLQEWHDDPSFFERKLDPQDSRETIARLRRAVREGGDHVLDLRLLASDGSPVSLRVYLQSACDWQGRPRSLYGVMIDVGSRRPEARSSGVELLSGNSASEAPGLPSSGRGRLPLLPRPEVSAAAGVDLDRLILLLEPVLRSALGRSIALRLSLEAYPAFVPVDPDALKRMLLSLTRYANRSKVHGGELAIETSLEETDDGDQVLLLTCIDTGLGLRRTSVFAPHFADRSLEAETTDLLGMVGETVNETGGSLLISDEPFGGTRFEIALPIS